jgi:AmiR/NasT family two-component response regulator
MTLLIVTANDPSALQTGQDLAARLRAEGLPVLGATPCNMLVREVIRLAPLGVILVAAHWDASLQASLDLLATSAPRPVLLVGAADWPTDTDLLLRSHVMAWLPGPVVGPQLVAAWAVARAHFDHQQALQAAGAAAEARLDERKWVDRAKGVLMHHQQLSEVDAFALLRTASMHANLRVGEVSRGLIEAAQAAEAVNRAGQLRMQSQRFVKGLVLRGMPRPRPDDHLTDTTQRLQANLDHLALLPMTEPVAAQLASTRAAWAALHACTPGATRRPGPPGLARPMPVPRPCWSKPTG